jgi:salicylate hydroxylase
VKYGNDEKRMPDGVDQRPSSADAARAAFSGWDPRIDLMLRHADKVLEWRLFTHHPIPSWAHPSKKLIIIGDACHAMTPYLAQGAAMGIEDAAVLGGLLRKYPDVSQVPRVIELYQKLRIPRTKVVAEASVDSRWFTQMPDGPRQQQRDAWLLEHPGIWRGHINIRSRKEFLDELFGYDADRELERELVEQDRADRGGAGSGGAGSGGPNGVASARVPEIMGEA